MTIDVVIAALFGYLIGAIPFGLLLTRLAGGGDIRKIGSGNIGATNVLRTGRKSLAAATLLLDALKGTAATLVAWRYAGEPAAIAAAGGAFLGHVFPVWLGFKGGKGVATFLGLLLALAPYAALAFALVWLAIAYVTRWSSAAGLAASAVSAGMAFVTGGTAIGLLFVALAIVVWTKHAANLKRLLAGTEPKIGAGKSDAGKSDTGDLGDLG